jgi:hypothetical protein
MMLSYTVLGLLQLTGVLRYRADLGWSRAAAVAYVCFLATILLLGIRLVEGPARGSGEPADSLSGVNRLRLGEESPAESIRPQPPTHATCWRLLHAGSHGAG